MYAKRFENTAVVSTVSLHEVITCVPGREEEKAFEILKYVLEGFSWYGVEVQIDLVEGLQSQGRAQFL